MSFSVCRRTHAAHETFLHQRDNSRERLDAQESNLPRCLRGVEKSGSRFTWKRLASEFRLPPDAMPHAPTPRALRADLKRKSRETNSSCSACKVLLVRKKSDNRPVECIRRSSVCRRTPVRRSLWASRCCSPTQMCAAPC